MKVEMSLWLQHRVSFNGVWSREFDPAFCQSDWSQALAPPSPHSLYPSLLPSLSQGQRLKCLRDGVGMLVWRGLTPSEDLTGALLFFFFFFFFLFPFFCGFRGGSADNLNPEAEGIVSGGLCYSRMDAGVSGPDKRRGQPGPRYLQ